MWQQSISLCSDFSKEASASFFCCFFVVVFVDWFAVLPAGIGKRCDDVGCRKAEICFVKKDNGRCELLTGWRRKGRRWQLEDMMLCKEERWEDTGRSSRNKGCWMKQNAVLRCGPGCKPSAGGGVCGARSPAYICPLLTVFCCRQIFTSKKNRKKIYSFFKNSAYCM